MNIEEIQEKINQLNDTQPWNHNFDLPNGLKTSLAKQESHGKNLVKYKRLSSIFELLNLKDTNAIKQFVQDMYFLKIK